MKEKFTWLNEPKQFVVEENKVVITTEADTDLWEKTHYGFSRHNAPMWVTPWNSQFGEFKVTTAFETSVLYDQCGIILYLDRDNWAKFSSEYENSEFQRLGGVVTKEGYSDWSTQNISTTNEKITYRVKRTGNDFEIYALLADDKEHQLRIFNLKQDQDLSQLKVGIYACSPQESSFEACFTGIELDGERII